MANRGAPQRRTPQRRARRSFEDTEKRDWVRKFVDERKATGIAITPFARREELTPTAFVRWVEEYAGEYGYSLAEARKRDPVVTAAAPGATGEVAPGDDMAPSGDWAADEGAQLKLAMGVNDTEDEEEDNDEPDKSETLLSRPAPPSVRKTRHKEGGHLIRRPAPEAFASVEPESGPPGMQAEFMGKINAELMADNAALVRVMKIMSRQ